MLLHCPRSLIVRACTVRERPISRTASYAKLHSPTSWSFSEEIQPVTARNVLKQSANLAVNQNDNFLRMTRKSIECVITVTSRWITSYSMIILRKSKQPRETRLSYLWVILNSYMKVRISWWRIKRRPLRILMRAWPRNKLQEMNSRANLIKKKRKLLNKTMPRILCIKVSATWKRRWEILKLNKSVFIQDKRFFWVTLWIWRRSLSPKDWSVRNSWSGLKNSEQK